MTHHELLALLERMDRLIKRRATGSPQVFATHLGISPSTLYTYLDLLRERGAPVAYCRWRRSYYYQAQGRLVIGVLAEATPEKS